MNKFNLVKKSILSALVILYNVVSLLWCYIIPSNFVNNLTEIQKREPSIGIIGGADWPTWSFIMGGVFGIAFSVLFVVSSLVTVFLFTAAILKKQKNQKIGVLFCVFSVLTLIYFMLIPAHTYVVSLYALVRKLSFLKCMQFIYIIISLIIIVINILFAIKRSNKIQRKRRGTVVCLDLLVLY